MRAVSRKRKQAARQAFRFLLVGGLNTAVDAGIFLLLTQFAGWEPLPASTASFLAGSLNSFSLNRQWTFRDQAFRSDAIGQYIKFMVVSAIVLAWHQGMLLLLHHGLAIDAMLAKLCGIGAGTAIGFVLNKYWVFDWSPGRAWILGNKAADGNLDV